VEKREGNVEAQNCVDLPEIADSGILWLLGKAEKLTEAWSSKRVGW